VGRPGVLAFTDQPLGDRASSRVRRSAGLARFPTLASPPYATQRGFGQVTADLRGRLVSAPVVSGPARET
jgi:hypothetical protein